MALPNVEINVIGAITRPALSADGISGILFYNDNIADLTDFSTTNRIIRFSNLRAVEATGITADSTNFKDEHYHLSQYFLYGGTDIYVGIFDVPVTTYTFVELQDMKLFSNGDIRLYAIPVGSKDYSDTDITAINTIFDGFETEKKPAHALYSANTGKLTLAALSDVRALSSPHVSLVTGQDGENRPADVTTYSLANIGAALGTLSQSGVEENILNVGRYNYALGGGMNIVALRLNDGTTDNVLSGISTYEKIDLDELNDKGHIFWRYLPNLAGTYLSNDHISEDATDTFNSIHLMRVRNKAIRELDTYLSSLIGANVLFNPDGTMRQSSIKVYENQASLSLRTMQDNGEISAFEVFIDPTQNVLSTKTVIVNAQIVPVESSDYITVNLAFTSGI